MALVGLLRLVLVVPLVLLSVVLLVVLLVLLVLLLAVLWVVLLWEEVVVEVANNQTVRGWVANAIPGVGGALNDGVNWWGEQSAKNDYYRNIEGGSVANALGERTREEKYRWNTMGVFSEAQASAAFKGVTRIGYTDRTDSRGGGTSRHEALDFISQGKQSRGQSVEEGLNQVSVASKSLQVDLGVLQGAMEKVSESAGKAGVNTELARRQMVGLMDQGIGKGQGAGAVGFAQAIEQTNVSYGKAYVAGTNSSGMYSNQQMYRAASASGMSPGALSNLTRNNPAAALQAYGKLDAQSMSSAGVTPAMEAALKEKIGDIDVMNDPDAVTRIADEFLNENPNLDPVAFPGVLSSLSGTNFNGNMELAAEWVVQHVAKNSIAANAQKNQAQAGKTDLTGKMKSGGGQNKAMTTLSKFASDSSTEGGRQSEAAKVYSNAATKSGERDPVIEALLKNDKLKGEKGDTTHVLVQTKTGGSQIVTLDEAISKYPNQVASGKVKFVDGAARGSAVSDLTGGLVNNDAATQAGAAAETDAAAPTDAVGKKAWENLHGKIAQVGPGDQGANTKVSIELSDAAKKWFSANASSGPINGAAASGAPPAGSTNGSRGAPGGGLEGSVY